MDNTDEFPSRILVFFVCCDEMLERGKIVIYTISPTSGRKLLPSDFITTLPSSTLHTFRHLASFIHCPHERVFPLNFTQGFSMHSLVSWSETEVSFAFCPFLFEFLLHSSAVLCVTAWERRQTGPPWFGHVRMRVRIFSQQRSKRPTAYGANDHARDEGDQITVYVVNVIWLRSSTIARHEGGTEVVYMGRKNSRKIIVVR